MKKKINFVMIGLPLLFLFILFLIVSSKLKEERPSSIFSPFLFPSPTTVPVMETRWSTDSGVLKMEKSIEELKKELDSIILKDNSFFPPQLNFGLEINP